MSKIILLYMKRIQIYHADLPISSSHQCRHAIIYFHIAKNRAAIHSSVLKSCGRWDLNPHKRNANKILSLARLPVPTLPHVFLFSPLVSRDSYIISDCFQKCKHFFQKNLIFLQTLFIAQKRLPKQAAFTHCIKSKHCIRAQSLHIELVD